MRIIGDGIFEISKGREKILALETKYIDEWKEELQELKEILDEDMVKKHQVAVSDWRWASDLREEQHKGKIKRNRTWQMVIGGGYVSSMIGLVLLLAVAFLYAPPLTMLFFPLYGIGLSLSFVVLAVILILFGKNQSLKKHGPELIPSPNKPNKGFSVSEWTDLESYWWSKMKRSPRPMPYTFGSEGENLLLQSFLQNGALDDGWYYIPNLLLKDTLDADAVLVGPAGIWVLESKYISGSLRLRNGEWSREKNYFESGGVHKTKYDVFDDFEDQWLRETRIIESTIKKHLPNIFKLEAAQIKGGLVFTHIGCSIDADSSAKIEFGTTDHWLGVIRRSVRNNNEEHSPQLSNKQVMDIIEALLSQSKSIDSKQSRSAVKVALESYADLVYKTSHLVESHPHELGVTTSDLLYTVEGQLEKEAIEIFETG